MLKSKKTTWLPETEFHHRDKDVSIYDNPTTLSLRVINTCTVYNNPTKLRVMKPCITIITHS